MLQVVSAVSFLHGNGILHRDIKDENIIINENFELKLIDFGSAAVYRPGHKFTTFYGTLEYCSPEVLEGNPYEGPELEVWSLGILLYILVFGENPFFNAEETIRCQLLPPFEVSGECLSLIKRVLEKDPKKRLKLDEIERNDWVQQEVDITKYRFDSVVPCSK